MKLHSLLIDRSVHDNYLCVTTPLALNATRIQDDGLAWVFRGLWCGMMIRKNALWICTPNLERWFSGESAWVLHASSSIRDALPGDVPKMFPRVVVTEALQHVDATTDGVDGIPFAIHKIQDRNARRVAMRAFQESRP